MSRNRVHGVGGEPKDLVDCIKTQSVSTFGGANQLSNESKLLVGFQPWPIASSTTSLGCAGGACGPKYSVRIVSGELFWRGSCTLGWRGPGYLVEIVLCEIVLGIIGSHMRRVK